jgi:hypothetical protein
MQKVFSFLLVRQKTLFFAGLRDATQRRNDRARTYDKYITLELCGVPCFQQSGTMATEPLAQPRNTGKIGGEVVYFTCADASSSDSSYV